MPMASSYHHDVVHESSQHQVCHQWCYAGVLGFDVCMAQLTRSIGTRPVQWSEAEALLTCINFIMMHG